MTKNERESDDEEESEEDEEESSSSSESMKEIEVKNPHPQKKQLPLGKEHHSEKRQGQLGAVRLEPILQNEHLEQRHFAVEMRRDHRVGLVQLPHLVSS